MDNNDITNTLLVMYKLHKRIIELQDRLIIVLKQEHKDIQIIEQLETLINELKAVTT